MSYTWAMEAQTPTWLDLYDYRLRVAAMYRERDEALAAGGDPGAVCQRFRDEKDRLFAGHPQSALAMPARSRFTGLSYFAYDPAYCVQATLSPAEDEPATPMPAGAIPHRRAAFLDFEVAETPVRLVVFWLDVYGGGLFLPFRDATCPDESYGAGRYLFDTVKGSTFMRLRGDEGATDAEGYAGGRVVLDFNFAYNPSCAYDERWICPLAPRENWLTVAIRAGERVYKD